MKELILDTLEGHTQYITMSIYILIGAILVTLAINFIGRSFKFSKYIPGLAMICAGLFSFFSVANDLFNPANFNNLVVFVMATAAGIVSLLVALIIGIIKG